MARRAPLTVPSELEKDGHTFLHYRSVEADAKRTKEGARDRLKGWLTLKNAVGKFVNGEEDENGNRIAPFTVAGMRIVAQKKTPTPYIDLEATEALLREKGGDALYDLVFKRKVVREFDEDQLFILHQQGAITDAELDALEVTGESSYSLVVVAADEGGE